MSAVANYNAAIKLAVEVGDNATKEILDGILLDEDSHVDVIEEKLDQVAQWVSSYSSPHRQNK